MAVVELVGAAVLVAVCTTQVSQRDTGIFGHVIRRFKGLVILHIVSLW